MVKSPDIASTWAGTHRRLSVIFGVDWLVHFSLSRYRRIWLPVVWIQMRMRDLGMEAAQQGKPLPELYHRLFWIWFAFGFPAFAAVLAIFWLMITNPDG